MKPARLTYSMLTKAIKQASKEYGIPDSLYDIVGDAGWIVLNGKITKSGKLYAKRLGEAMQNLSKKGKKHV